MQERWIQPLGQKDDLEKEMATHSSILRMSKTRNLFKKIKDTKGTFHAKISTIKDRKGKDLRKAEEIKKRGQAIQKCLNDPDNHNGVITHVQSDILE